MELTVRYLETGHWNMQHWLGQAHLLKRIQSRIVSMFQHAVSVWKIKKVQKGLIRDKEKGVHRSDSQQFRKSDL